MENKIPSAIAEQSRKVEEYYTNRGGDPKEEPSEELETTSTDTSVEQQKQTTSEPKESSDNYELRFKNFKASADRTIHEQRLQIAELQRVAEENQRLQDALQEAQKDRPKFSEKALDSFSKEELEVFDNMLEDRTSGLIQEIKFLKQQLMASKEQELTKSKEQEHLTLKQQVAAAVPDFQKIDTSPEFRTWLNKMDSYGVLRMDALRKAQANKDIGRIVSFYNDFKQIQEPVKPDPREYQQVPDGSNSSAKSQEKPTRVWDREAVQRYYKDVALGKVSDKQKQEIEQEIFNYYNRRSA